MIAIVLNWASIYTIKYSHRSFFIKFLLTFVSRRCVLFIKFRRLNPNSKTLMIISWLLYSSQQSHRKVFTMLILFIKAMILD